ncbi:Gp49 family protein [Ottowia sp. VDI28]|uniref:Gp49 family protein n=1 Tax=Ottowia sp. VDI28 TaxID=3133968 RepID=UPI003C2D6AF9
MNSPVIPPTVGRVVWFHPAINTVESGFAQARGDAPLAAIIARVWSDNCVNLAVFDANGNSHSRTSVLLVQDADACDRPAGNYCTWMPFQKGQAAKTEAAKSAAPASGTARDPRDVASDPQAILCGKLGEPIKAAPIALTVIDTGPDALEREIQAKANNGPRVTPTDIQAEIASVHYFVASDAIQHENAVHEHDAAGWLLGATQQLTFCVIQLRNGFTVTGESACASPENFNAEIGRRIARENAVNKMWLLLGFRLKDNLHALANGPT